MKCKCCSRDANDLRYGCCFDCANAESIIADGTDMWDNPIEKRDGMSMPMSKLQEILKIFNVVKEVSNENRS